MGNCATKTTLQTYARLHLQTINFQFKCNRQQQSNNKTQKLALHAPILSRGSYFPDEYWKLYKINVTQCKPSLKRSIFHGESFSDENFPPRRSSREEISIKLSLWTMCLLPELSAPDQLLLHSTKSKFFLSTEINLNLNAFCRKSFSCKKRNFLQNWMKRENIQFSIFNYLIFNALKIIPVTYTGWKGFVETTQKKEQNINKEA